MTHRYMVLDSSYHQKLIRKKREDYEDLFFHFNGYVHYEWKKGLNERDKNKMGKYEGHKEKRGQMRGSK